MKPIFSSLSPHEIYHLRNLLQSAGIPCRIHNEHLASLAGEVPFTECAAKAGVGKDAFVDADTGAAYKPSACARLA